MVQLPTMLLGTARLYIKEKKLADAESSLRRALERFDSIEKANHLATIDRRNVIDGRVQCLETLASVMANESEPGEAGRFYQEALSLNKNSGGRVDNSLRISKSYANLLRSIHKDEQADRLEVEINTADLTAVEVNHNLNQEVARILSGPFDAASSASKLRTLSLAAERLQKRDRLEQSLHYLGIAELCCGELEKAEAAFRRCIAILKPGDRDGVKPTFKASMATELAAVACCLECQGKSKEAQDFYQRAINIDSYTACQTIRMLGIQAVKSGKDQWARLLAERLITLSDELKEKKIDQIWLAGSILSELGQHYRSIGKFSEAEAQYKRALQIFEQAKGAEMNAAYTYDSLADTFTELHQYPESESMRKRHWRLLRSKKERTTPRLQKRLKY